MFTKVKLNNPTFFKLTLMFIFIFIVLLDFNQHVHSENGMDWLEMFLSNLTLGRILNWLFVKFANGVESWLKV